jgi:hypothetical protein
MERSEYKKEAAAEMRFQVVAEAAQNGASQCSRHGVGLTTNDGCSEAARSSEERWRNVPIDGDNIPVGAMVIETVASGESGASGRAAETEEDAFQGSSRNAH